MPSELKSRVDLQATQGLICVRPSIRSNSSSIYYHSVLYQFAHTFKNLAFHLLHFESLFKFDYTRFVYWHCLSCRTSLLGGYSDTIGSVHSSSEYLTRVRFQKITASDMERSFSVNSSRDRQQSASGKRSSFLRQYQSLQTFCGSSLTFITRSLTRCSNLPRLHRDSPR